MNNDFTPGNYNTNQNARQVPPYPGYQVPDNPPRNEENYNSPPLQPENRQKREFNYQSSQPQKQPAAYHTSFAQPQAGAPQQIPYPQRPFNLNSNSSFNNSYAPSGQYIQGNPFPAVQPPPYGYYGYVPTPREIERNEIRKSASVAGKETLIIFLLMQGLAIIVVIIAMFTGVMGMPTEGDPYSGFTPMGFYIFEGMLSLVSIALPTFILIKSSKQSINKLVPFEKINGRLLTAMVFGGMAVCMIAQLIATLFGINMSLFGIDIYSNTESYTRASVFDFLMSALCTAVIPALVEEFAYRGLVLGVLRKHGDMFAVISSAFLFGLLHGNFVQIPFAFVVGLVLGYVRVKTDSMLPSVLIHFGNNFFAVVMTTVADIVPESIYYILESVVMIGLLAAGFIAISFIAKNYREFFEYKENSKMDTLYSYKEKLKIFFSNGFILADTIILGITALLLLIPTDEIASSLY